MRPKTDTVPEAWRLLGREVEFRHHLIEASHEKMGGTYDKHRRDDPGAWAKPERGFRMRNRNFRLARATPENAADVPAAREVRIER